MGLKTTAGKFNPFPGLRPFLPEESDIFFGRKNESEEVLNKLLTNRFVTVTGGSGSGKSSLVYSGVIPRLVKQSEKENAHWKIISFRPGKDPLDSLAKAFTRSVLNDKNAGITDSLAISRMKDDPDWIINTVKNLALKTGENILVVVDQFEELFTYNPAEAGIATGKNIPEFVTLLENSVKQTTVDIYVIITMRSDFIGNCASYQGFTRLMNSSNFLVPRMTWENYKSVIENPVKYTGAQIDPKLVITILNDLGDRPDQLPVLQHTLMRTYSFWLEHGENGRPVELSDYYAIGTISGAMSRHANEAYDELSLEGREICKRMFKTITGKGSDNKGLRHPSDIGTIRSVIQCSDKDLMDVIEKFRAPSRSFITPAYPVPLNDDSVIDLTHESLMRLWGRLKEWVDDEASSVRMYKRLSEASAMYQQGKAGLLKNPDLQLAVDWRETQKPNPKWAGRYDPAFERAMVYLRTSEKASREEEENKVNQQKRKLRNNRLLAIILGGVAVVAIGFMLAAFIQKISSEKQKTEALRQKEEADAQAYAARQNSRLISLKLASADSAASAALQNAAKALREKQLALKQANSVKQISVISEMNARDAYEQKDAVMRRRMVAVGKSMALKSLQLSDQKDLQSLLAYQGYIFNRNNGGLQNDADIYSGLYTVAKEYGSASYKTFPGHDGGIKSIAFVPEKREFFTSGADGKVFKWNLDGRNRNLQLIYSGTEIINVIAVSPDKNWLACGEQNASIKMISLNANMIGYDLNGHSGEIKSLIFSFDGRYLYSASLDGKVLKWDLSTRTSTDISTGMMKVTSIDMSSDNKYIAGISNEGRVMLWNPEITSDNFRIESPGKTVQSIRFKPGEKLLAIGYTDGYLELWDILSRKKITELKAHASAVSDIRFNSKLSQIATAAGDGSLKLWDSEELTSLPVSFNDDDGLVVEIEFSPDGQVIVSGTTGGASNLAARATSSEMLAADVASVVTRNFTPDEWVAYVGKDIEYQKTITDSKYNIKVNEIR